MALILAALALTGTVMGTQYVSAWHHGHHGHGGYSSGGGGGYSSGGGGGYSSGGGGGGGY
jgi:hypothetical protein